MVVEGRRATPIQSGSGPTSWRERRSRYPGHPWRTPAGVTVSTSKVGPEPPAFTFGGKGDPAETQSSEAILDSGLRRGLRKMGEEAAPGETCVGGLHVCDPARLRTPCAQRNSATKKAPRHKRRQTREGDGPETGPRKEPASWNLAVCLVYCLLAATGVILIRSPFITENLRANLPAIGKMRGSCPFRTEGLPGRLSRFRPRGHGLSW